MLWLLRQVRVLWQHRAELSERNEETVVTIGAFRFVLSVFGSVLLFSVFNMLRFCNDTPMAAVWKMLKEEENTLEYGEM